MPMERDRKPARYGSYIQSRLCDVFEKTITRRQELMVGYD
jgi:hypothetical protein